MQQTQTVSGDGYLFRALQRFRHHAISKRTRVPFLSVRLQMRLLAVIRNKRNIDFRRCFCASLVSCLRALTLVLLLRSDSHLKPFDQIETNSEVGKHAPVYIVRMVSSCSSCRKLCSRETEPLWNLNSCPCAGIQDEGGPAGREAAPCLQHAHGDPLGYSQPEEVSDPKRETSSFFSFFFLNWALTHINRKWHVTLREEQVTASPWGTKSNATSFIIFAKSSPA